MSIQLKSLMAAAVFCLIGQSAQANLVGSDGGGQGGATFYGLTAGGLTGGLPSTLVGGNVLLVNDPNHAAMPTNTAPPIATNGAFLAVGGVNGASATLTFTTAVPYISFLWGSPDTYNVLTLTTEGTGAHSQVFHASDFAALIPITGVQSVAAYVQFLANGGELIKSITWTNDPTGSEAFEVSNFNTPGGINENPVPGPIVGAGLPGLLAACGGLLLLARRRRREAI